MLLNFITKLKRCTMNIINTILDKLIIIVIAPLAMSFVLGAIGKITKISFISSLGGFCLLIFFIILVVIIIVESMSLIFLIIYTIKCYILKKSLKGQMKQEDTLYNSSDESDSKS